MGQHVPTESDSTTRGRAENAYQTLWHLENLEMEIHKLAKQIQRRLPPSSLRSFIALVCAYLLYCFSVYKKKVHAS